MTFNGLTDIQAESARKKYGSNRLDDDIKPKNIWHKLKERYNRITVKICIIVELLYWVYLFWNAVSVGSMAENWVTMLILQLVMIVPVVLNCVTELYFENTTIKKRRKRDENPCHVYRCGNTIVTIPSGDIVKGDYVLVAEGDIVPADGILVYGDITANDGDGNRLIRNFTDCDAEENSSEYTVKRNSAVTSGYAVIKITEVGGDVKNTAYSQKPRKSYVLMLILTAVYVVGMCVYTGLFATDNMVSAIISAAALCALAFITSSERLRNPLEFFAQANEENLRRDGIKAVRIKDKAEMLFVDKSAFVTDGKPVVTSFADGEGNIYGKCYEIPYPLGTVLAKAVAETTSPLINRGNIIGTDAVECAEASFISERINGALELEIKPSNIKGTEKNFDYKKLLRGFPDKIIPKCKFYFDGAGNRKVLSNNAAILAMADEIIFQGSSVIAYAALGFDGEYTLVGMITVHEKLRKGAASAFRAMCGRGVKAILLTGEAESEAVSMTDKAVTGAGINEVISFDKLVAMDENDARRMLPTIKVITGNVDKEYLLALAQGLKFKTGITVLNSNDIEVAENADMVFSTDLSCAAAKRASDVVLSDGLSSLMKYEIYCKLLKNSAAWYGFYCTVATVAHWTFPYLGAIAAALVGVGNIIFCRIGSLSDKTEKLAKRYKDKYDI